MSSTVEELPIVKRERVLLPVGELERSFRATVKKPDAVEAWALKHALPLLAELRRAYRELAVARKRFQIIAEQSRPSTYEQSARLSLEEIDARFPGIDQAICGCVGKNPTRPAGHVLFTDQVEYFFVCGRCQMEFRGLQFSGCTKDTRDDWRDVAFENLKAWQATDGRCQFCDPEIGNGGGWTQPR